MICHSQEIRMDPNGTYYDLYRKDVKRKRLFNFMGPSVMEESIEKYPQVSKKVTREIKTPPLEKYKIHAPENKIILNKGNLIP